MKSEQEIQKLQQAIKDLKNIRLENVFDMANYIDLEHRHLIKTDNDNFREETDDEFRERIKKKIELQQDLEYLNSKDRELNSFERGIKEETERILKNEI